MPRTAGKDDSATSSSASRPTQNASTSSRRQYSTSSDADEDVDAMGWRRRKTDAGNRREYARDYEEDVSRDAQSEVRNRSIFICFSSPFNINPLLIVLRLRMKS